jgi:hypothetical protein
MPAEKDTIDHIFAVQNPRYRFEMLETIPIQRQIAVSGGTSELSDHTGYFLRVRIHPEVLPAAQKTAAQQTAQQS